MRHWSASWKPRQGRCDSEEHDPQTVCSREYKLMLRAAKFKGEEDELRKLAAARWADLAAIIVPHAVTISGTADIEHRRPSLRFRDIGFTTKTAQVYSLKA